MTQTAGFRCSNKNWGTMKLGWSDRSQSHFSSSSTWYWQLVPKMATSSLQQVAKVMRNHTGMPLLNQNWKLLWTSSFLSLPLDHTHKSSEMQWNLTFLEVHRGWRACQLMKQIRLQPHSARKIFQSSLLQWIRGLFSAQQPYSGAYNSNVEYGQRDMVSYTFLWSGVLKTQRPCSCIRTRKQIWLETNVKLTSAT